MAGIIKTSYFSHLTDFLEMAPYPIFFRALKTIIMPNFMLLTESEQFKHISALLYRVTSKGRGPGEGVAPKKF